MGLRSVRHRRRFIIVIVLFIILGLVSPALAHQPVERKPDVWPADGRLFILDGDGSAVDVIDFPDGRRVARLPVPPHPLSMGLSPDRKLLFVFRGRSTEEDWVTVIRTGFDAEAKAARRPVVLASFQGEAPGGVEAGDLAQAFGRPAIVMEKTGVLTVYDGDWGRPGGVRVRTIRLAAPDHIHFVETDDALYVGFLRQGFVQAIDKATGAEFARLSGCPALHGVAYDPDTGRTFWGCKNDVMVVGTRGPEKGKRVGRIPLPDGAPVRVAAFAAGA
ncbi:MAG: hypothetical protein KM312_00480, partial [Hydrogenibacillus schlegelii]|nr:hypothetical protein [Hydrogenibacillus schlegelii]